MLDPVFFEISVIIICRVHFHLQKMSSTDVHLLNFLLNLSSLLFLRPFLEQILHFLFQEKSMLENDNMDLRSKLMTARTDINKLRSEVAELQQYSAYLSLKRMEMLNMNVQTDV